MERPGDDEDELAVVVVVVVVVACVAQATGAARAGGPAGGAGRRRRDVLGDFDGVLAARVVDGLDDGTTALADDAADAGADGAHHHGMPPMGPCRW